MDWSLFFFRARTGEPLGSFVHPRPQTATENCTWHNYNIVPVAGRDILVSGNYQSGISVVDFTDPANASEIAYADPAPLVNPQNAAAIELGGDWSTYWYDGYIYESDITRGVIVWKLNDDRVAGARGQTHLNPQTMYTALKTLPQPGNVSGTVPATLALSIGGPATFGAFTPGATRDYETTVAASVISSAGDASLSVADASGTAPGHLVNGSFVMPQALQARASSPLGIGGAFTPVGSSTSPTSLLTYGGPVSNDAVAIGLKQAVGATDALRTGTYSKTLTFTLSTTTP